MSIAPVLEVRDLSTCFHFPDQKLKAVDGIRFQINRGEVVAIVGESGCGKSLTAFSIMGLLSAPGAIDGGEILFEGQDLARLDAKSRSAIQGNRMAMIFQEPLTSLNPLLTIGLQLDEPVLRHTKLSKAEARAHSIAMLRKVSMPRPEAIYDAYPHELSGGMRQRVMIAMALSCNPSLLIADEPTTALDVTIQAQILELMKELQTETQMAMLLITHDLGVVAEMADRVIVMYGGQIVEQGDAMSLFANPSHPYSQGLFACTPNMMDPKAELQPIKGTVPALQNMPRGCRFHPRCPHAQDRCTTEAPGWSAVNNDHQFRCWLGAGE